LWLEDGYDNDTEIMYGKVMKKVLVPSTETPEVVPKKVVVAERPESSHST
jgi:hypothetical protein